MNKTEQLILKYGLSKEVEKFVMQRAAEFSKGYTIAFQGNATVCFNREPHVPHKTGTYSTVEGEMEDYCKGIEGNGIEIITLVESSGSPSCSSYFKAKVSIEDSPVRGRNE